MPPLVHRTLDVSKRSARGLVRELLDGELSVQTPYQRDSVWTVDQRVDMIKSWLTGVPLPAVILNERTSQDWKDASGEVPAGEPVSVVIDGRQRLETAVMWFTNKLAVPREWFAAEDLHPRVGANIEAVYWANLSESTQRNLSLGVCMLPVAYASAATVQEEAEVYLLVNSAGTSQTAADLERAAQVARGER